MKNIFHFRSLLHRGPAALLFAAVLAAAFTGCSSASPSQNQTPISSTAIKLNTVITITIYDSQDQSLLSECMKLCDTYEKIFSRTLEDSELYKLNHRQLPSVSNKENTYKLSDELSDLIRTGLTYTEESQGAFDIAIAPLSSLWDFTADDPQVPSRSAIENAVSVSGCDGISLTDTEITLPSSNTALDLGAIAKGYIADRLKEYLVSKGVKSALIDLGGNVLCVGEKPDGSSFRVGVQKPFADRSETIGVINISDKAVVSSGIYERYFVQDDVLYHHILNPSTGYPYDNGLISVTVICDNSTDGDALSTCCFALGLEKGLEFAQSRNIPAIFITEDYELHYTEGFENLADFTVSEENES